MRRTEDSSTSAKRGMSATCRGYTSRAEELLETCEELGVDDQNVRQDRRHQESDSSPQQGGEEEICPTEVRAD